MCDPVGPQGIPAIIGHLAYGPVVPWTRKVGLRSGTFHLPPCPYFAAIGVDNHHLIIGFEIDRGYGSVLQFIFWNSIGPVHFICFPIQVGHGECLKMDLIFRCGSGLCKKLYILPANLTIMIVHMPYSCPIWIDVIVFIGPCAPVLKLIHDISRGITPVNHHPGIAVFQNPHVGISVLLVRHVLCTPIIVVNLRALVAHPYIFLSHPTSAVVWASPENHITGQLIEPDHNIRPGTGSPEIIPQLVVLKAGIIGSEFFSIVAIHVARKGPGFQVGIQ